MLVPELQEFAAAVLARRAPSVSAADGRRVLNVLDAVTDAARTAQQVTLRRSLSSTDRFAGRPVLRGPRCARALHTLGGSWSSWTTAASLAHLRAADLRRLFEAIGQLVVVSTRLDEKVYELWMR